jgi:hypothetical protein
MKMDSNLFKTIKNEKFRKFDPFWPKNSHKVQNGLDHKGDVLEKNVI